MKRLVVAAGILAGAAVSFGGAADSLVGKWSNGRVSMIQYRDRYTGVGAPTSGSHFAYEFRADGTYQFNGLMQNTLYNCTTSIFSTETGVYKIDGQMVSMRPENNIYKMTNNCSPSSNSEKPGKLIDKTYKFRVTAEQGVSRLEFVSPQDPNSVQQFRRE